MRDRISHNPSARPLLSSTNHAIVACYREPTLSSGVCAFVSFLNAWACRAGLVSIFPHLCFMSLPSSGGDTSIRCMLHSNVSFSAAHGQVGPCLRLSTSSLAMGVMVRVMKTLHRLSHFSPDLLSTTQWELCLRKEQTWNPSGLGDGCPPAPAPFGFWFC